MRMPRVKETVLVRVCKRWKPHVLLEGTEKHSCFVSSVVVPQNIRVLMIEQLHS
jgi:hypothetical protein